MSDDAADILRLEEGRARAIAAADRAWLAAMTAADYRHVDASGRQRCRRAFLDDLQADGVRSGGYRLLDNEVRVVGDLAVVTGSFHNDQTGGNGDVVRRHARHVRVYVRGPAGWMNVLHQATAVAEDTGAARPRRTRE